MQVNEVVAWDKIEVVDAELSDLHASQEVGEGDVAELKREDGWIRNDGLADEVVLSGLGGEVYSGLGDLESGEGVESWLVG